MNDDQQKRIEIPMRRPINQDFFVLEGYVGMNTKEVPCIHDYWKRAIGHCWWCEFVRIIQDISERFNAKWNEYGGSYKTCPIKFLVARLDETYEKLQTDLSYEKLIDIANVATMLAKRMKTIEQEPYHYKERLAKCWHCGSEDLVRNTVRKEVDFTCKNCGRGWKFQSDGTWHSRYTGLLEVYPGVRPNQDNEE